MNEMERITAAVASDLVKTFISNIIKETTSTMSKKYSYLIEDFSSYLDLTLAKCSYVRTIVNKDRSYNIEDIYVPAFFQHDGKRVSDNDLISDIIEGLPTVLVGFGGIGKTVFTKYLWITALRNPSGKVPVFLELRQLNKITDPDLVSYIRHLLAGNNAPITQDVFEKFLKDGRFLFILDGFDELIEEKRGLVEENILELRHYYPSCGYVVSSRHDDRFSGWQQFATFKACAFSKDQVLDLVRRVDFDRDVKKKFIDDIVNKKYDEYSSFLSTPLLTLMMLMTFSQFAEVPDKRHIFYKYAFLTLYSWHDASKEAFRRESKTGLVVDQFEKAFSIFCLLTYMDREFSLDDISMRVYIERTKKYIDFDFDSNKMIDEIIESVNFMYKDGDIYVFTHRSFQEYFTAFSIVHFFASRMEDIIKRIYVRSDIVLPMMYEINRDVVEENYILPVFNRIKKELENIVDERESHSLAKKLKAVTLLEVDTSKLKYRRSKGKERADRILILGGVIFTNDIYAHLMKIQSIFSDEFKEETRDTTSFLREAEPIAREIASLIFSDGKKFPIMTAHRYGDNGIYWCRQEEAFPIGYEDITSKWTFLKYDMSPIYAQFDKAIAAAKELTVFCYKKAGLISRRNEGKQKSIDEILG